MSKKFIQDFEKKIKKDIKKYDLFTKKDKVFVACSGGKDSTTALYLLNKFGYDVESLIIDLMIGNWSKDHLKNLEKFCDENKIKLHVISMRDEFNSSICYIRSGIQSKKKLSNCMICGVIKRWLINKKARELGATKLVTGHNLDDAAETVLMNMFKGNQEMGLGLGPKSGILTDKKFVQRIKPLYFCTNEEIKKYSKLMKFPVIYDPCPCSTDVFRRDVRKLIDKMEKKDPDVKQNIVKGFLDMLPVLRERYESDRKLKYCKVCGEPTRNEVCKRCQLMKILHK